MSWDKEAPSKAETEMEHALKWDSEPPDEHLKNEALAGLQGFGNSASLGYMPQLQAAAEPGFNSFLEKIASTDIGSKLMDVPKDAKVDVDPSYVNRRDAAIKRQETLKDENPWAYGGGALGGALTSAVATAPLAGARALSAGGRIAQGASQGAALGFASNPGDKEGEVDDLQLKDRGINASIGGALGGTFTGGIEGMSAGAKGASNYFGKLANEKAVKAAGAMKSDFKNMDTAKVQSMGKDLLDDGIVTPFARPKVISERLQTKQGELISKLDEALKKADSLGEMNLETATPEQLIAFSKLKSTPEDLKQAAIGQLKSKFNGAPDTEMAPGLKKIDEWLTNRPDNMSAKELQQMKTSMNPFLDTKDFSNDMAGMSKEGLKALRSTTRQAIEDKGNLAAEALGEAGGGIRETNRKLGSMLGAEKLAENAMARDAANRSISLTDSIAGAGGLSAGSAIGGAASGGVGAVAMAGANKVLRSFGDPLAATGLNSLSKQLIKIPKFAAMAQDNPGAFQSMIANLSNSPKFQKVDPEWSKDPMPAEPMPLKQMGKEPEYQPSKRLMEVFSKNPEAIEKIKNPKLKDAVQKQMNKQKDPRQSFIEGN